jgi:hypothetical protein
MTTILSMKSSVIAAFVLLAFGCVQTALGYSPIWTVDGWDVRRLNDAGITIKPWKHEQIGEDPAFDWVQVSYDTSKVGGDQNVLMTLQVIAEDGQMISAHRAERKKGDPTTVVLLFAVRKESVGTSYVNILHPELLNEAAKRGRGNPGFGGYSLRLSRVMELAAKHGAEKPAEGGQK